MEDDVIGGFNRLLDDQKKAEGEADLTLILFDSKYHVVHQKSNIKSVGPLTKNVYYTGGSTSMNDAIMHAIKTVGNEIASTPENERPHQVVMIIHTDGHENSSVEFSNSTGGTSKVQRAIATQKEKYDWKVIMLGADIENLSGYAAQYDIDPHSTLSFSNTSIDNRRMFRSASNIIGAVRSASYSGVASDYLVGEDEVTGMDNTNFSTSDHSDNTE